MEQGRGRWQGTHRWRPVSGLALPLLLSSLQIRRGWKNRKGICFDLDVWVTRGNSSFYICPSPWDSSVMLIMENEGHYYCQS